MKMGKIHVKSMPYVLRIEPTNICNLRCPRCSCGIGTDPRPKGFMDLDDFKSILACSQDYAIILRLDGNGEPTLHPHIFDMVRIAKALQVSVSMSTSFTDASCEQVEEFIDSGLDRLVVAIDGSTQESYEKYRVGGQLASVENRVARLIRARNRLGQRTPFTEIQFLDWGYNHDEIPVMKEKAIAWGADKFQVISPDWPVTHAKANPLKPHRCFWLWSVLTIDWNLDYRSCTNAWTLPWPRLSFRDIPPKDFWNHCFVVEARQYNIDKGSNAIADDPGCHCNMCSDMLVVDRPPNYVCE
jgi:hypothetical protein